VRRRRWFLLAGVLALATLTIGVVSAAAGGRHDDKHQSLAGSWIVTVDRGPAGPLKSLQTYSRGGGLVETANLEPPTARGPGHGAWTRLGHGRYGATNVFFRFDPQTLRYTGTTKLRMVIELSRDGNSFTAVTVAEFRDANGNLLPGSNVRRDASVGERIQVEPLPS
jgi:hypothetical protein